MKISELASELINLYGDIEVVEILHREDADSDYENITSSTLRENNHMYISELLSYSGHEGEKIFVTGNMRGYIDGATEKTLLLDFNRYVEEEEDDENV